MKVIPNDFNNKSTKDIRKIKIIKKSRLPSPINQRMTSPILKTNKTIQKYINEKLDSIKKNNISKKEEKSLLQKKSKINFKNHPNLIMNKLIINPQQRQIKKNQQVNKKQKNNKENNKKNNKKKKVNNFNNYKSIDHYNKSLNIILNKKQKSKESKLINSLSTSSGLSFCSNENKKNLPFNNKEIIHNNNNHFDSNKNNNYNSRANDTHSISKINSSTKFIGEDKQFIEDTNRTKHINNFNYESGSEDNFSDNKIYLKCDNYSLLTFGNSFSYSNSKRSKSTIKKGDNNNLENNKDKNKTINICKDLIYKYDNNNNYVSKLKEENETLKKELKESNDQISFLMYQIKELKQNKNSSIKKNNRNKKICSPNIWKNKNIKLSLIENKNSKKHINNNFNKNKISNKPNDKFKFNKDFLKDINKEIISKNSYNNCKKKIHIIRKYNLSKIKNKNISISVPENSHYQNISDYISNLKI